jgi:hypothetical protein
MTRMPAAAILLLVTAGAALAAADRPSDRENTQDTSGVRVTEVRNWSVIDTDKDGYISAEEMEQYLAQAWERGKGTATTEGKKTTQ